MKSPGSDMLCATLTPDAPRGPHRPAPRDQRERRAVNTTPMENLARSAAELSCATRPRPRTANWNEINQHAVVRISRGVRSAAIEFTPRVSA
jgi:hypothetical protein